MSSPSEASAPRQGAQSGGATRRARRSGADKSILAGPAPSDLTVEVAELMRSGTAEAAASTLAGFLADDTLSSAELVWLLGAVSSKVFVTAVSPFAEVEDAEVPVRCLDGDVAFALGAACAVAYSSGGRGVSSRGPIRSIVAVQAVASIGSQSTSGASVVAGWLSHHWTNQTMLRALADSMTGPVHAPIEVLEHFPAWIMTTLGIGAYGQSGRSQLLAALEAQHSCPNAGQIIGALMVTYPGSLHELAATVAASSRSADALRCWENFSQQRFLPIFGRPDPNWRAEIQHLATVIAQASPAVLHTAAGLSADTERGDAVRSLADCFIAAELISGDSAAPTPGAAPPRSLP